MEKSYLLCDSIARMNFEFLNGLFLFTDFTLYHGIESQLFDTFEIYVSRNFSNSVFVSSRYSVKKNKQKNSGEISPNRKYFHKFSHTICNLIFIIS